jgi:uncharacterized protein YaaW (UPF0174 family)
VYGKTRYKGLNETEVMQNLLSAILWQSLKDLKIESVRENYYKLDAINFLESEYCELICYVARKDYYTLCRCVLIGRR